MANRAMTATVADTTPTVKPTETVLGSQSVLLLVVIKWNSHLSTAG